jgi:hypothetical protein
MQLDDEPVSPVGENIANPNLKGDELTGDSKEN